MTKTFAVDFDGTCVDHQYPLVGDDVPGAVDTLRKIASNGDKIILNTMRSDRTLSMALRWFEHYKLPLYGINQNPDQKEWTNSPKVFANYYIDDAAVGCPLIQPAGFQRKCVDWAEVRKLIGLKED